MLDEERANPRLGAEERDRHLMGGVRLGEASAFDELLRIYWDPLVSYADSLLESIDAAEDVVQETFIRVWERRSDWSARGSVRSYLYRITRTVALNEHRRRRVRKKWLGRGRVEKPSASPTPLQMVEGEEMDVAIDEALAALPDRRREVFTLARLHDLSYREIADLMQISPQTVANQMSAALADLRRSLRHLVDDTFPGDRDR